MGLCDHTGTGCRSLCSLYTTTDRKPAKAAAGKNTRIMFAFSLSLFSYDLVNINVFPFFFACVLGHLSSRMSLGPIQSPSPVVSAAMQEAKLSEAYPPCRTTAIRRQPIALDFEAPIFCTSPCTTTRAELLYMHVERLPRNLSAAFRKWFQKIITPCRLGPVGAFSARLYCMTQIEAMRAGARSSKKHRRQASRRQAFPFS